MYNDYEGVSLHPTASISINKNKLKSYGGNFYLKDKQEFEIELFNPTDSTHLAKITINGKSISNAGIVVKPGQRIYLERFLDVPKRFAFETYTINSLDNEALASILHNGDIEISFYDEEQKSYNTIDPKYRSKSLLNITNTSNCFYSNSCSMDSLVTASSANLTRSLSSEKETGRIEQGSNSNQKFTNYNGKFNSWTSNIIRIKLLPFSEKPFEVQNLAEYCTNCGTKNKKGNYNYCPKCGHKFD